MRREEILNGKLRFPEQIMNILNPEEIKKEVILEFWESLWHNYLRENTMYTITWYDKLNDEKLFNKLLMHLSKSNWINSVVDMQYVFIELNNSKILKWITKDELSSIRFKYRLQKYRLNKTESKFSDIIQINNKHIKTGLIREGFKRVGNLVFQYDTKYLQKYVKEIAWNIKKGIKETTKDISYQEIVDELIEYYSIIDNNYTLGNCYIDSRGRSIFQCTKKILNPVSHKDARALLICKPQYLTPDGLKYVYAAIAELLGYRGKNIKDKIHYGECAYICRELPNINKMHKEKNYDDLHILIWLERIYENLDCHKDIGWYVPIENDALASLIQLTAVLTNDIDYMVGTNMIGTEFNDIWTVPYCSREHVKKALTPILYGSMKEPKELWIQNKLPFTQEQINLITNDLRKGKFANANKFKNFIISRVKPKKIMKVKIFNEEFTIECNRFKKNIETIKEYYIYNSSNGLVKKVTRTVNVIPNLREFKRFFQTLLLHNLDSQICNTICTKVDWVLPNHDSFTAHPNNQLHISKIYTDEMYKIWRNRKNILIQYFKSIGITETYKEMEHDYDIKEFSIYCLK